MADRFPSIEEFSGGQTDRRGDPGLQLDPTTSNGVDFLAREKAALGDDADLFASADNKQQNTDDDDDDDDDDLLGDDHSSVKKGDLAGEAMSDFQSAFPAINIDNPQVGPGGTITGNNEPFLSGPLAPSSDAHRRNEEGEAQAVKEWRQRRALAIQHRDEVSERRKTETIKAAQAAIDDFYENYNIKKEKTITQARDDAERFLANREDTSAGGTSWERIAKLVDLSGKGARGGATGTGKERFRDLLLSLKKDERAPGVTGY